MPVKYLNSSVLVWPDRRRVEEALGAWAAREAGCHPELCCLGFFGSYARGDWGVGSDLDLVAVVEESDQPMERRNLSWDTASLPVGAQLLVFTRDEWSRMKEEGLRLARVLEEEVVWVSGAPP